VRRSAAHFIKPLEFLLRAPSYWDQKSCSIKKRTYKSAMSQETHQVLIGRGSKWQRTDARFHLSIAFYDIWRRRPTVWNASSPEASAL